MSDYIKVPLYEDIEGRMAEMYVYLCNNVHQLSKAIIILGGGGFNQVNLDHEGHQFAQWLNNIGVVGIVLNYRQPNEDKEITEMDLREAVRIVRLRSEEWNIDRHHIGAAGFSIGGHAVSLVAVREEEGSKLDFTMLFYSVTDMSDKLTHIPSRDKLLGNNPSDTEIHFYSSSKFISEATPRALIMACDDDKVVSPLNSVLYYEGLKKFNVPSSLCIFPFGGHGWGMREDFPFHKEMLSIIETWLRE